MISSTGNAQVREAAALAKKAKERREQGLFIVEGAKMFSELPSDHLVKAFVSENFLNQLKQQKKDVDAFFSGRRFETVTDEVMHYMSDTRTPQGVLAVARQFSYSISDILPDAPADTPANAPAAAALAAEAAGAAKAAGVTKAPGESAPHIMVLETIQDPGNLGTILRAGEGAGITGVIMNRETADIYNPKVIRSTMGSIYRVPFVYTENLVETITRLKRAKVRLYAAHLRGENNYEDEDYRGATGFLIGNEANGLSDGISAMADCYVKIPMAGRVESLNAAVAASVLMFETARQRRRIRVFPKIL